MNVKFSTNPALEECGRRDLKCWSWISTFFLSRSKRVLVGWKAWKADPTMKNDGHSTLGGCSGRCGHGVFHVHPALFCDPLDPRASKKMWGEPRGTPASSVDKLAHPRSVSEESLRESQRETGNRQPPMCVAAYHKHRALPKRECIATNIKNVRLQSYEPR